MRWWEWLKKGWNSYVEAAQAELLAYLPADDESEAEQIVGNVNLNHQDKMEENENP